MKDLGKAGLELASEGKMKANPAHVDLLGIFLAVLATDDLSQRQGKNQCPFVSSYRQTHGTVYSYKGSSCRGSVKSLRVHG